MQFGVVPEIWESSTICTSVSSAKQSIFSSCRGGLWNKRCSFLFEAGVVSMEQFYLYLLFKVFLPL